MKIDKRLRKLNKRLMIHEENHLEKTFALTRCLFPFLKPIPYSKIKVKCIW